jgi:hypothetical protein
MPKGGRSISKTSVPVTVRFSDRALDRSGGKTDLVAVSHNGFVVGDRSHQAPSVADGRTPTGAKPYPPHEPPCLPSSRV